VFLCILFAGVLSYSIKERIARNKREAVVSVNGQIPRVSRSHATSEQADSPLPARALYPFSVIPGGVENVQELRKALARDPVAADHYAEFDLAKAHVIRLNHDWSLYVSYRMGDRIFWTSKKLQIHKDERVITDGVRNARTRCGNLLSAIPILPVSPREPSPAAMEAVAPPEIAVEVPPLPFQPINVPPPPPLANPSAPPAGPPAGPIPPPFFPIPGPPGRLVGVPEPSEFSLVAIGTFVVLTAGWFFGIRKKRKA
jgi:hypothetical protein